MSYGDCIAPYRYADTGTFNGTQDLLELGDGSNRTVIAFQYGNFLLPANIGTLKLGKQVLATAPSVINTVSAIQVYRRSDIGDPIEEQLNTVGTVTQGIALWINCLYGNWCNVDCCDDNVIYSYRNYSVVLTVANTPIFILPPNPQRVTLILSATGGAATLIDFLNNYQEGTLGSGYLALVPNTASLTLPYRDFGPLMQDAWYAQAVGGTNTVVNATEIYKVSS
jgi:hypothetical protein